MRFQILCQKVLSLTLRLQIGGSAFIGLGVYTYASGHFQLQKHEREIMSKAKYIGMNARKGGITGVAALLVGMGLWRFMN